MSASRHLFVFACLLLWCSSLVVASSIERTMPQSAPAGEQITITLQLSQVTTGSRVVLSELLADGVDVGAWSVGGAQDGSLNFVRDGQSLIWEFVASVEKPVVTYTAILPKETGVVAFNAVYALPPDDFGQSEQQITVVPATGAPVKIDTAQTQTSPQLAPETAALESPVLVSQSLPFPLIPVVLIGLVMAAIFLYLRSRVRAYGREPKHTTFAQWVAEAARDRWNRLSMDPVVMEAQVPAAAGQSIERFSQDQQRLLERLEAYQGSLPKNDIQTFEMLEQLKGELRSISFARKDF